VGGRGEELCEQRRGIKGEWRGDGGAGGGKRDGKIWLGVGEEEGDRAGREE